MRKTQKPTDTELEILRVLWKSGPSTVRQVNDEFVKEGNQTGYTTTLKMMQIMAEKGLLQRDESARSHIYSASLPEEETKDNLVSELIEKAFGGAAGEMVMHALSSRKLSKEDLSEIHKFLTQMENEK